MFGISRASIEPKLSQKDSSQSNKAHPHKFRATFLTWLLQSGCDIANVQALAGHKSIKTTQPYWERQRNSAEKP